MITRRETLAGMFAVGAAGWSHRALADGKIVRVPLRLEKSKPVIDVTIGSKGPFKFVLDTGASTTVIRADLARELNLQPVRRGRSYSIKGSEATNGYVLPHLTLGGALHLRDWSVFDSVGFQQSGYDGLLSADLLTRFQCQLDHRAGEIRYYEDQVMDLSGFGPLNSFYKSEGHGDADKVHLKLNFPGHELDCILDTGAGSRLFIRGDYVKTHGLWDKYPVLAETQTRGVNGQAVKVRLVEIKDFQVGGVWVPRMAVSLADPADDQARGRAGAAPGLIGAPFLSAFILAFANDRKVYIKSTGWLADLAPPQKQVSNAPVSTDGRPVIPFVLGDDRRLAFPVQLGAGKGMAVLRLGIGKSEIGTALAEKIGLPKLASGAYDGAKLSFGGTTRPGLVLMPAADARMPVALGMDFVRKEPCLLDLDDNYMVLYREEGPDLAGYDPVLVVFDAEGRPFVAARIAGRAVKLKLDTGTGYGVLLSPRAVQHHGLWDAFPGAEDRLTYGSGGAMNKIRYAVVKGLEFGAYRVDPAPLTLCNPEDATDADYGDADGIIGIGVLWRFNMIFNGDKVWFRPNKRFDRNAGSLPAA